MTKDYDKLLGRDDTEKVLVDVTNYFFSMKPRRPYLLGHHKWKKVSDQNIHNFLVKEKIRQNPAIML